MDALLVGLKMFGLELWKQVNKMNSHSLAVNKDTQIV